MLEGLTAVGFTWFITKSQSPAVSTYWTACDLWRSKLRKKKKNLKTIIIKKTPKTKKTNHMHTHKNTQNPLLIKSTQKNT